VLNLAEKHDVLVQVDHVLKLFGSYVCACKLVCACLLACFLLGQLTVVSHAHTHTRHASHQQSGSGPRPDKVSGSFLPVKPNVLRCSALTLLVG